MKSFSLKFVQVAFLLLWSPPLFAGVSDEIEKEYRAEYENKALFLKIPIRGEKSTVYLRGQVSVIDPASMGQPLRFKVGEQVRIAKVDFDNASVSFEIASIDLTREAELTFRFDQELTYSFAQREEFDAALADSFTEGLTYRDIDRAKEEYVKDQFDRVINQFSITTGLESKAIVRTVLESTPDFARNLEQLEETRAELSRLEEELEESNQARDQLQATLASARDDLSENSRTSSSLRNERDRLTEENTSLREELEEFKAANERFIRELESATSKMDLQGASNAQLGNQVETLSSKIEALMNERTSLKTRVESLTEEFDEVVENRDELSDQLRSTERRRQELQSNLSSLTSNRDSLEANFVRTKREKESLETAQAIANALNLSRTERGQDGGVRQATDVYLKNQKVGSFTVTVPSEPTGVASLKFEATSPNLVQFDEEERKLYEALGDNLSVEAEWSSWSNNLDPVLVSGEPSITIAAREEGSWEWEFEGAPQGVEVLALELSLQDSDGNHIPLDVQQFEIGSGDLLATLKSDFSLLWLAIGCIAGASVLGLMVVLKDRSRSRRRRSPNRRSYAAQKKL